MVTDELLVHRAKSGDLKAYEILIRRYQHKVYNLAAKMVRNREDARDLAQDTFIRVYQNLPRFRGDSSFGTWVYRVASNKCLDYLRKKKVEGERVVLSTFENDVHFSDSRDSPEESAIREDENRRLRDALDSLPKAYRIAIILQHYQQLSYKEIAEVLELPVKTVATRIYRAKIILREKLTGGEAGAVQAGKGKPGQLPGKGISVI